MVMPGDNVEMTVELIAPIAIENGTKFSIREGGRTVGAGVVSSKNITTPLFSCGKYILYSCYYGLSIL